MNKLIIEKYINRYVFLSSQKYNEVENWIDYDNEVDLLEKKLTENGIEIKKRLGGDIHFWYKNELIRSIWKVEMKEEK